MSSLLTSASTKSALVKWVELWKIDACKIIEYVLHTKQTVKDIEMKWIVQALRVPAHKDQTRMPKVRSRPGQNNETLSQKKLQK